MDKIICNFARKHAVEIYVECDCLGHITITMERDEYKIKHHIGYEEVANLNINDLVLSHLNNMVQEIDQHYVHPVLFKIESEV